MIKTRFAPSPTGELHIGGARTALFAYLFAKSNGGKFDLRIEDTDRERYVEGSVERIVESLKWLGIMPDNVDKPMIQSERKEVYKKHAFELVNADLAYICTCTKEKLVADREKQEKSKLPPRYEGHCREKKRDTRNKIQTNSNTQMSEKNWLPDEAVVRMKMPENEKIVVNDLVRGKVEFDSSLIDDQIILKSDGFPTYHLAAVVDDHEMEITHIIRAEEWLSSTPKHIVLFKMFGWDIPKYAHLPMILGSDKKKLSKRHGATSVNEYKDKGYLPQALVNFMVFLGWNPKDDNKHHFTLETLSSLFKIENVNKAAAIFDIDKLNSINEHYLMNMKTDKLQNAIKPFLKGNPYDPHTAFEIMLMNQRGGFSTLVELAEFINVTINLPEYPKELLVFKKSSVDNTKCGMEGAVQQLSKLDSEDFKSISILHKTLTDVVEENKLTNGDVFWPIRVALSGKEKSPTPEEYLRALGHDESIVRLQNALERL